MLAEWKEKGERCTRSRTPALTFYFFPYNFSKWIFKAETRKANAMQLLRLLHSARRTLNFNCARRSPTKGTNIKSHGKASNT